MCLWFISLRLTDFSVLCGMTVLLVSNDLEKFYIHGSVHRNSILIRSNKVQQYAGIYLLQNYSTCFGCPSHTSSGVYKTATAASGAGHITYLINNFPPAWTKGH